MRSVVVAAGGDGTGELQLLELLEAGGDVLAQVLHLALVVRPEVVLVHAPPLQLQEVLAGLHVVERSPFLGEAPQQQAVAAPQTHPQVLLGVLDFLGLLGLGLGAGLGGRLDGLLAFELGSGGGVEHAFVAEAEQFCLVDDGGEEVGDGGLLVDLHVADFEGGVVLQGLLAVLEALHVGVHGLHAFPVLQPLLRPPLLRPLRHPHQTPRLAVERADGQLRLPVLELLPHLHAVCHAQRQVEFLEQFLHNLVLHHPVGPPQTALVALTRSEGQHVVVLVGIGPPQRPQEREAEFLPPVLPEVVDDLGEQLHVAHLQQLPVFALDEAGHPPLPARQRHVLPRLQLQLHERPLQELGGEGAPAAVHEAVLVAAQEGVVDLGELVVAGEGEVEVGGEADVVGREAGEGLDDAGARDGLDLGDGDVLFGRGRPCRLLRGDDYHEALVVGVQLLEGLPVVHELERLRPVVLVPVPHPTIKQYKYPTPASPTAPTQHNWWQAVADGRIGQEVGGGWQGVVVGSILFLMWVVPNLKFKTEYCLYWLNGETCLKGSQCFFAHSPHELRTIEQNHSAIYASPLAPPRPPNYKTRFCRFYAQGECQLGDHCTYAHERRQRRQKAAGREEQREAATLEEEQAAYFQYYNQLCLAQQFNSHYPSQLSHQLQPPSAEKEETKQHSELSTPDMCASPETKTQLTTLSPAQQEFILKQPPTEPL